MLQNRLKMGLVTFDFLARAHQKVPHQPSFFTTSIAIYEVDNVKRRRI